MRVCTVNPTEKGERVALTWRLLWTLGMVKASLCDRERRMKDRAVFVSFIVLCMFLDVIMYVNESARFAALPQIEIFVSVLRLLKNLLCSVVRGREPKKPKDANNAVLLALLLKVDDFVVESKNSNCESHRIQ